MMMMMMIPGSSLSSNNGDIRRLLEVSDLEKKSLTHLALRSDSRVPTSDSTDRNTDAGVLDDKEQQLRAEIKFLTSELEKRDAKVNELQKQIQQDSSSKRAKGAAEEDCSLASAATTTGDAAEVPTLFVPTRATITTNGQAWTLPTSRFTHHIRKLVDLFDPSIKPCVGSETLTVTVRKNMFSSSVQDHVILHTTTTTKNNNNNNNNKARISNTYRRAFEKRVVTSIHNGGKQRLFPLGSVTLPISIKDGITYPQVCAFGASAPKGFFSIFNWQDVRTWRDNITLPPPLPWEEREKVPVWRGTPYLPILHKQDKEVMDKEFQRILMKDHTSPEESGELFLNKLLLDATSYHRRLNLCRFSLTHPELVNAKPSNSGGVPEDWWQQNVTNGLYQFLPFDPIPSQDYYTKYQVSIVMGGLRAAFRTSRIMSQGIAVMLQEYPYEEWFVQYMTPWVHYIPLAQDLSDLSTRLQWVRDNPQKVHTIAMNGKAFYDRYLSYDAMDEFYYELIFRLLIKVNSS